MLISRKWLSQYMDISDLSIEEISKKVTDAGFEVEGIEHMAQGTNLIIGFVESCQDHPDSDHLHVTKVNIGSEVLDIVCGAPNVATGQKVIVAQVGAQLPGGEIKAGNIRGQASNGMICSLLELGVDPHSLTDQQKEGIEVLPEDAPIGETKVLEYLGLDDEIMDIGLTPNRNDCMAAFNMAMETGAILNREVTLPDYQGAASIGSSTSLQVKSETDGCPSFLGKVIGHIKIKESPKWIKELLAASGVHSINNVVDISNLVMLETGQPMHFYHKDAIVGQEITVKDGFDQDYVALDGETYHLQPEDIVITNQGKPIGIAGIMGGDDSKILDTTESIIIECAMFDHVRIRNTARRLSLSTESSVRYQKGIEPLASQKALNRAVQLLIEYADASEIEETVVYGHNGYEEKTLTCSLEEINYRLGTDFTQEEVLDVFTRLQFKPELKDGLYTVHIPSHRTDIEGMADLSEEVIRMIGFDRLPSTLPLMEMTEGKLTPKQQLKRLVRNHLCQQGLQDCITYTLVSTEKKENAILSVGDAVELSIPMSEERRWIRSSILPSLLDVVAYNRARSMKDINVFELSDVASNQGTKYHMAFVLSGSLSQTRWMKYDVPSDFYSAKGIIESLLDKIGIAQARISYKKNTQDTTHFHPYRSAEVWIGKECVGIFGEIHPAYGQKNDCKKVVMGEFDLDALLDMKKSKIKYAPMSKYQSVNRDLSFLISQDVDAATIVQVIQRQGKVDKENIIRQVEVFDIYQGSPLEANEKSVAVSILFQSDKDTLTDQQMNTVFENVMEALEKNCGATIRK